MRPAAQAVWHEGGFATRAQIVAVAGRPEFDAAVRDGDVVWISWGRYGLPGLGRDELVALGVNGVLSHTSAALWHGWEVKTPPAATHVTVPRRRRLAPSPGLVPHYADVPAGEVDHGICTSARRTLLDCLRTLPGDEGLTVADSALRRGVPRSVLDEVARLARGPGRPAVVRAVAHADLRAANPFESCLRSIALDVAGLRVEPQVSLGHARPDLVDPRLRLVLEAESFSWHGDRAALRRDARRYNLLVADGWVVLRFSWEDVMFDPLHVRQVLTEVVDERTRALCPACRRPGALRAS